MKQRGLSLKIIFSRHAKGRMRWRKISEEEVKATILKPEKIEESKRGRKNAFKHIDRKWIKVTFIEEGDTINIISALDKNN